MDEPDELKKKILVDINKTGFVNELVVGSRLLRDGWHIVQNGSYLDKDHNKSREIDITAHKSETDEQTKMRFAIELIIEVKSSKRPWIILSSSRDSNKLGWSILHSVYNFIPGMHLPYPEVGENIMRAGRARIGTAFHEAFKSPTEPSRIFEAVVSACKAATARKDVWDYSYNSVKQAADEYDASKTHQLHIFVPVVVLDGLMFEVFLDENGEVDIYGQEYMPIEFNYSSPNYPSMVTESYEFIDRVYYPDIVTVSGLEEYLAGVEKWRQSIYSKVSLHLDTR